MHFHNVCVYMYSSINCIWRVCMQKTSCTSSSCTTFLLIETYAITVITIILTGPLRCQVLWCPLNVAGASPAWLEWQYQHGRIQEQTLHPCHACLPCDTLALLVDYYSYYRQEFRYRWSSSTTRTFTLTQMKIKTIGE